MVDAKSACPVCSGTQWTRCEKLEQIARPIAGPHIVCCQTCGLRRIDPMPSQEQLREIYEDDRLKHAYGTCAEGDVYVSGDLNVLPHVKDRFKLLEKLSAKPGRLLDIGAAQGAFLAHACSRGWEVAGLEFSEEGIARAEREFGLRLQASPVVDAGFEAESFDAVNMSHVLEHVPNLQPTVREIHRILKRGGLFCVEVPNEFDDLFGRAREVLLGKPREKYTVPTPHTYFFTPPTLKRLFLNHGFKIEHFATPRRNASVESARLLGKQARTAVFRLEHLLQRGPLIEVIARKA